MLIYTRTIFKVMNIGKRINMAEDNNEFRRDR